MIRTLPLITALCASSVLASEFPERYQDVYLAASYSSHELLNKSGDGYGLLFGARDIYTNSLFIGGELEAVVLDNSSLDKWAAIDEEYAFSASIPVGVRFDVIDNVTIDAYGLAGYSVIKSNPSLEEASHGIKYGGGLDVNIADWKLGVRYTRVDLKYDLDQQDITFMIGHTLSL
ncbi:porin family protein [Vibrio aquaticus]|uniref:Porin family protein n=1 Tax=Vibrio aquaticus TaxID=2496559 RepID=A0A3S0P950_9VIBR|nr:outer membrane beta-barrel protein [Vibrio aquaticus]RTZ18113.1 porin family protein [Vibrio aquaticus]